MLLILPLILLCSSTHAYRVQFVAPVPLNWINCYTTDCVSWQACPTTVAALVCVRFTAVAPSFYLSANNTLIGYNADPNTFYDLITMVQQSTYSFSQAQTDTPPTKQCNGPSTILSGQCLTPADSCLDPLCPTTSFFETGSLDSLTLDTQCVASYKGYGSVYGTPCEPFAPQLSPYFTKNVPNTPGFTDYGVNRQSPKLGCYYEKWAKYRPKPYTATIDSLAGCDIVFFFVNTLSDRSGNMGVFEREEGDWNTIAAIKTKFPTTQVFLTFGGWTSDNKIMSAAMSNSTILNDINTLSSRLGVSVDFDIEFPGSSNGNAAVFPYDEALITSFMTDICNFQHSAGRQCAWGGLSVGSHWHPTLINKLSTIAGVDYFPIFGYDLHGSWAPIPRQQSALVNYSPDPTVSGGGPLNTYSLITSVDNFLTIVPASKLILGLPMYARGYLVDSSNSVLGSFPLTGPMLGPGETGSDLIVTTTTYGEVPATYNPVTDTIRRDPDQPGFYIMERPLPSAQKGLIYFMNTTTFAHIHTVLKAKGVFQYYLYASSMDQNVPSTSLKYSKIIKTNRQRRAVNPSTVFYNYPTSAVNVPTNCPNIVLWAEGLVATTSIYQGCQRENAASSLCWYRQSSFLCVPSTEVTLITKTTKSCKGINTNTLLPTSSASSVMCLDLTLYTTEVSLCGNINAPTPTTKVQLSLPSPDSLTWGYASTPIYSGYLTHTEVISKPPFCTSFTSLPSCAELICGSNSLCYTKLTEFGKLNMCTALGDAISVYNSVITDIVESQATLDALYTEMLDVAMTKFGTVAQTRKKRFVEFIALGVASVALVEATVAIGLAVANANDIRELRGDVKNLRDESAANFKAIEEKHNAFVKTTADGFAAQNEVNKGFNSNIDTLQNSLKDMAIVTSQKFKELDQAIQSLVSSINSLQLKLDTEIQLSANSDSALARVLTALSLGHRTNRNLDRHISQVRTCLASIQQNSLAGCVNQGSNSIPLGIRVFNETGDLKIVFFYATRQRLGYLQFKATSAFCTNGTLVTAAPGCIFTANGTQIEHSKIGPLTPCGSSFVSLPIATCPTGSVDIEGVKPSLTPNFEVPQLELKPPKLEVNLTNVNLSDYIRPITPVDLSKIEDLQARFDKLNLTLTELSHISSSGSGLPTWAIIFIVCVAVVIVLVFIVTIYMNTRQSTRLDSFLSKIR